MTLGGLSGNPVKRHVTKEEGRPKPIIRSKGHSSRCFRSDFIQVATARAAGDNAYTFSVHAKLSYAKHS